jgi:hypothetical protein
MHLRGNEWQRSRARLKPKKHTLCPGLTRPVEVNIQLLPRYGSLWVPPAERRQSFPIWQDDRWPASRCRNCFVTRGSKALSGVVPLPLALSLPRLFSAASPWRSSPCPLPSQCPLFPLAVHPPLQAMSLPPLRRAPLGNIAVPNPIMLLRQCQANPLHFIPPTLPPTLHINKRSSIY